MIVTVKTKGAKIKALEQNLVSQGHKKSRYWIRDSELNEALRHIHDETGICKVKIELESKKSGKKKKLNVNSETTNGN